ncbi:hypothetical protein [Allostreptomyces psammosilenae]|uniref:DNA primase n=1 Tax=Allostreptomyces psammosilenae TaxID=1892865 RepID=A0A852ZWD1_9ACTN|nr:hypothetical protein [Allostreptomyces psammosilenae]NYI05064.1 hypothetical protein [Allostreptomyces psammosilenae]
MASTKLGAALVGGYVLGRTRKTKLALATALWLAGKGLRPGQLARSVAGSPALGELNKRVRDELLRAGKSAATTALTARADRLADSLDERTRALRRHGEHTDETTAREAEGGEDEDESSGAAGALQRGARAARAVPGAAGAAARPGHTTSGRRSQDDG